MKMIEICATVLPKVGFASHQNAVPLLAELTLENTDQEAIEHATLVLSASPAFIVTRIWSIDRLAPGALLRVADRKLEFDAGMLAELNEALRAELTFSLRVGGAEIAAVHHTVECLPRMHWGGAPMLGLLPAFCMPNDPAVDQILKSASDILRAKGERDAIDGYKRDHKGVWLLTSAIWSAVRQLDLSYALPPASFEAQGQKLRSPSAIMAGKLATCLDSALLFAACLEQAALNPVILLIQGHAFVGVWLREMSLPQWLSEEPEAVRKHVVLNELLIFETTLAARQGSFQQAIDTAKRAVEEEHDGDFRAMVDIHRARMQRIRPLGSAAAPVFARDAALSVAPPNLDLPPAFTVAPVDEPPSAPTTPQGRLAHWQRKLLDLTTRNRLLHVSDTAKAVRLLCYDAELLEDRLASGKKITIAPLPDLDLGGRDVDLYEQQTRENLQEQVARPALAEKNMVYSSMDKTRLEGMLVDLYRTSRTDMLDGGANTLFLALGFMKWRKSNDASGTYRAPLVLLPVQLERKSAASGIVMTAHEDEPRFNLTLLELLRQDFNLDIPGLDTALPASPSGNGIDLAAIWTRVRLAVRDMAGFEVTEQVMLGTFSFGKYLMWKDMADRAALLTESPVVKHLIERGAERFRSGGDFPRPRELDRKVDPAQLFLPLPANSSQIAGIVASANGCDFVLDGPPGTGKSQTIANMIAHNLAMGRRVLFVAEKMAALNVVYRRLEEKGLGEFCLELHSNKAAKVDVLKQLERAWDARDAFSPGEWAREAEHLRMLRDRLNEFVEIMHREQPNGMTLHEAIGVSVGNAELNAPRLAWPAPVEHSKEDLARLWDIVRRLEIISKQVAGLPQGITGVRCRDWSNAWQDEIVEAAMQLPTCLSALLTARDELLQTVPLPVAVQDLPGITAFCALVEAALATHGHDMHFAFSPNFPDMVSAVAKLGGLVREYHTVEGQLSVQYADVASVPVAALELEWQAAVQKFFLFAKGAKKKAAERLGAIGAAKGTPSPEEDLPRLRRLQALAAEITTLAPVLQFLPGWNSLASDMPQMHAALARGEALRNALAAGADSQETLILRRQQLGGLVVDGNALLAPGGSVAVAHRRCTTALAQLNAVLFTFTRLAGTAPNTGLNELGQIAAAVIAAPTKLKSWCDWQRVAEEAHGAGLAPILQALQQGRGGHLAALFETAYARWFAGRLIDAEPRLREFVPDVHTSDIATFRKLEDKLARMAARYARARLCGRIPDKNEVGKKDGYGILKHQLQLQKRHKPIRQLVTEMGDAFTRLAPCMLMSPLSIAQYLPPEQPLFDLVIFDEASQIAPWDAIGAMARGRQVVVAGDPKQMPPTNFFGRAAGEVANDDEADMESILDECLAAGLPQHTLDWHYRSQHESLIAFSNNRYYENRLITFPAPVTRASAVSWRRVHGVYAKGRGRTNPIEAQALVDEAVARLTSPAHGTKTLGIIVLNAEQQQLVEDLLDRARQQNPDLERFFGDATLEPVFVKNLETVQGDERDIILLGVGYGPTEPGAPAMSMNFGPLNRDGGWRRLNVALTRARAEMVLFTSFDASMVDLNRTSARAVRDLKHFIEFAERGPRALAEAVQGSVGGFDSPFEAAVAEALTRKGWQVVTQIGVSRFRIDLGIVHPDRPGDYLVGVECDGAAYHSAATARDRDKVRQAILETLGWKLLRVWSTDWWVDKADATEKLHTAISALLEADRTRRAAARDRGYGLHSVADQNL